VTIAARHRLLLMAFCASVWLPGLPARTLWPTDEPRYALLARDMTESGDYVVPVKRGEAYHSQPPLFLWAEVASGALMGGVSEAAVRVPSFLAALSTVLLVHALAANLFTPTAALMSALVLAADVRFLLQAQWASTDMMLCFFMTATLAAFYTGYRSGRRWWYLVMYAAAGLAAMTKGPVGFALPGLVIVCFLLLRRDLKEVLRMRLPLGAAIVSGICAPWILLFWHRAGGSQVANLVLKQSLQRYTEAWNNLQPWYYFLWRFPADFLPWTPIFPIALWASTRMEKSHRLFLWCWFAAVLLFFSASSGKRGVYILPLHPAAAILVGWLWDSAYSGRGWESARRWLRWARGAVALLFCGLGVFLIVPLTDRLEQPLELRRAGMLLGLICLAACIGVALAPPRRALPVIAGATGVLALAAIVLIAPLENRRQNVVGFSAEIARLVPPAAPLGIVRDRFEDLVFYSRHSPQVQLRGGPRLDRWMQRPETVYAVLDQPAWERVGAREGVSWNLLANQKLAGEDYYLIVKN
jgi:4-amino-4-deoxy-L-arabinose transferase-like glycosyltransferase